MKALYVLEIDEEGKAELVRQSDMVTLWSSDSDPDVLEEFGTDHFDDADGDDLVEYLVDREVLSESQADHTDIASPAGPGDDDEDDDEDDDGEYTAEVEEERL